MSGIADSMARLSVMLIGSKGSIGSANSVGREKALNIASFCEVNRWMPPPESPIASAWQEVDTSSESDRFVLEFTWRGF